MILKRAAETFYRTLERLGVIEILHNDEDAIACVIFILSGLKELGDDIKQIAEAFEADYKSVEFLLRLATINKEENESNKRGE